MTEDIIQEAELKSDLRPATKDYVSSDRFKVDSGVVGKQIRESVQKRKAVTYIPRNDFDDWASS